MNNPRRVWVAIAVYAGFGLIWALIAFRVPFSAPPLAHKLLFPALLMPIPALTVYSEWHNSRSSVQILQLLGLGFVPSLAFYFLVLFTNMTQQDPMFDTLEWAFMGLLIVCMLAAFVALCCFLLCLVVRPMFDRLRSYYSESMCQCCGYNLTGNVSGRCPECGIGIPDASAGTEEHFN